MTRKGFQSLELEIHSLITPPFIWMADRSRDRPWPEAGIGSVTGILVYWLQEYPPPLCFDGCLGGKSPKFLRRWERDGVISKCSAVLFGSRTIDSGRNLRSFHGMPRSPAPRMAPEMTRMLHVAKFSSESETIPRKVPNV